MAGDPAALALLLQEPFMQRALLGGLLTGTLGGLLGSFAVLRQLSFFSEAIGDAALLGLTLGILLGLNPTLVLIPFAVALALLIHYLLHKSRLSADALLNIVCSSSLAIAVVVLSLVDGYRGNLHQLLFGDILGIAWSDLTLMLLLLGAAVAYLGLNLRSQALLTLDDGMAKAFGVRSDRHRLLFLVLLSVVVAVSIKTVGVLLISAFVVIPASASRLLSRSFPVYLLTAAALGGGCAVLGLLISGLTNLPSGPCVVIIQFAAFLLALLLSQLGRRLLPG